MSQSLYGVAPSSITGDSPRVWHPYVARIKADTTDPVKGTTLFDVGYWRWSGDDSIEISYLFGQNGAGSNGSGSYSWQLPPGFTTDYSVVPGNASYQYVYGKVLWNGGSGYVAVPSYFDNGISVVQTNGGTVLGSGTASFSLGNADVRVSFRATVPVKERRYT